MPEKSGKEEIAQDLQVLEFFQTLTKVNALQNARKLHNVQISLCAKLIICVGPKDLVVHKKAELSLNIMKKYSQLKSA